ncbi:MAG: GntR family transcriptional regulator [Tepidisphaeraceae bacterium]
MQAILQSIFTGKFKSGDRLVEEELALTTGVSRTPIREALGELAGVGVIDLRPNQGAIVRPFGPTQVREMYHLRRVLESEATRLATGRVDPAQLHEIRQRSQELLHADVRGSSWSQTAIELDQQFHELISAHCENVRLAEEIGRYRGLVHSLRLAIGNTDRAMDVALVEHTQIIDCLLCGVADAAGQAMARHLDRGMERAVHALFPTPSASASDAPAKNAASRQIHPPAKAPRTRGAARSRRKGGAS